MSFGKAFHTLKEANTHAKTVNKKTGRFVNHQEVSVRKMCKKVHPRRKKLFHVGTHIDFLNFA